MTETAQSRTWAEISLDNLARNYHILRSLIPKDCRLLGIVKANAYGHGAREIGAKLERLGADMLAVACLDEAVELRQEQISLPILCLGHTPAEFAPLLLEYDITQTVFDSKTARVLSDIAQAQGRKLTVHIKLDTGMTRLGIPWAKSGKEQSKDEIIRICSLPGLVTEGLFTHFADADGDENYTRMQFERFSDAKKTLAANGVTFAIYHCAASSSILNYPCTHMDMIRPGIALYGYPGPADCHGFLPVMTLKSRVAAVRSVPAGTFVGYGCTALLLRDTRLAILPIGYADGFSRHFSNGMEVLLGDRLCPVVGRVCMDMCMIDVTDAPDVTKGDIAEIYGKEPLMPHAQKCADTISNDLLSCIASRVPRVYIDSQA